MAPFSPNGGTSQINLREQILLVGEVLMVVVVVGGVSGVGGVRVVGVVASPDTFTCKSWRVNDFARAPKVM